MVMLIQSAPLVPGIAVQAAHGDCCLRFGLYFHERLARDASGCVLLAALAFLIQALAPNKYVGYFAFITFYCLNAFAWPALNVATSLVQFAGRPKVIYSDFFG